MADRYGTGPHRSKHSTWLTCGLILGGLIALHVLLFAMSPAS